MSETSALSVYLDLDAEETRNGVVQPHQSAGAGASPAEYPRNLDELHARLVRWFETAESSCAADRELAERDRWYYEGRQWSAEEMAALRRRGQPDLTINYVRRKVELLSGLERRSRTDPKAYPRTPEEDDRAEAATQALRFVHDDCDMPDQRSAVYQNMLVEGYGGVEFALEDDGRGGADVSIKHIPWSMLFYDPHSRRADFADIRFCGSVIWTDRETLLETFPEAEDVVGESFSGNFGAYEDRPGVVSWQDNQRTRVRLIQMHWHERGEWWSATYTRAGFMSPPERSPFKDKKGRSTCRLQLQSAYVDQDNARYGAVRDLISLQDEINKRRSKALHLLNVNRVVAEQGAVEDVDRARAEVARPDGFIEVMPGLRFEVMPGGELAAGQMQLLQHATGEMQASGPNASMAGNDPRELSGRAILAQQAGGAAQAEPLADALRSFTRRIYEIAWMAVREFWVGERWLRVTDDFDNATKWMGINRPVTLAMELGAMAPEERAFAMQQMRLMPGDPRLQQVVRTEYGISDLEVDIVIEEGPDVPAQAAEQFQQLSQMVPAMPPQMQLPAWKILLASSSFKDKGRLLKMLDEAEQGAMQAQQQQAPVMQAKMAADLRDTNAKAAANEALAQQRLHGAAATVAQTEKLVSESPAVPVGGPGIQPQAPQGAI